MTVNKLLTFNNYNELIFDIDKLRINEIYLDNIKILINKIDLMYNQLNISYNSAIYFYTNTLGELKYSINFSGYINKRFKLVIDLDLLKYIEDETNNNMPYNILKNIIKDESNNNIFTNKFEIIATSSISTIETLFDILTGFNQRQIINLNIIC